MPVIGDTMYETDETFSVTLGTPTGAVLGTSQGTGQITNDDPMPTVSIAGFTASEGNTGTTGFGFLVRLTNASYQAITVPFGTVDGTATVAGNDYTATSGTLTISSGSTSGTIIVPVIGDTKYKPDETFAVTLGTPSGAILGTSQGTGQINNDDPMPTVSIAGFTASEGNSGTTGFGFLVSLTNPSYQAITVPFGTVEGTATVEGSDYTATSGTLTISSGSTSGTIIVPVIGDTKYEPDETFSVTLGTPTGAILGTSQGTGTILNDDYLDITLTSGVGKSFHDADGTRSPSRFRDPVRVGST